LRGRGEFSLAFKYTSMSGEDSPPEYSIDPANILDPLLVMNASQIKAKFKPRNIAFAKAVVKVIVGQLQLEAPNICLKFAGRGYGYTNEGNIRWDALIGYSVWEAFSTEQIEKVEQFVRLDLETRGFRVVILKIYAASGNCSVKPEQCKESHHGVYVKWELDYE
jgi:hypothetical protein